MKKLLLYLFFAASPLMGQTVTAPTANYLPGIYTGDIDIELLCPESGAAIYYTLNGNEPTTADYLYTGPIPLGNRSGDPNSYSTIPTNPSFTHPVGNYTDSRADDRGWLPPYSEVYKINVLRFRAFKPGMAPSETVTRSYMIEPAGASYYTMPIVSIVVDSMDIFSDEYGYYVYGDTLDPPGNYTWKGPEWERMAHVEFFDENGNLGYAQDCRSRIHGGGSRQSTKKSFRLYGETGAINNFHYQFFPDTEQNQHKRILIKSGGHRPDCFPRDDLSNMITKGLNVDQQHYRHVILFINGEYWGIHAIKERMDGYFFQNIYGIDDNDLTVLDQEFNVQDGYGSDSAEMKTLENFIIFNDMTLPANYQYIKDRIDIDNYIDYMSSEIFLSNVDWVYSNVVMWRKTGDYVPDAGSGYDGKFRWAFYDLDGAFGGSCSEAYYTVNTLDAATITSGTFSSYTRFFRGLLNNEEFRNAFINRMSDLTNSWFRNNVLIDHIDSIYNEITPEMLENAERWRYPSVADNLVDRSTEVPSLTQWDYVFDRLHVFADRRQRKVREHIMTKWGYPDTSHVTVDVNDVAMGRVQVNTILINEELPGVDPALYPWDGIYIDSIAIPLIAVPLPGYEFVKWIETGETSDTVYCMLNGDTAYTALFAPSASYSPVLINEAALKNDSYYADNFGDYDDWSELFNPNAYPVNLSDCKLILNGQEWLIPNGTIIDPNAYYLFWHDEETYQGSNHVSYILPNENDTLFLISPNGSIIDYMEYFHTSADHSYGRFPNGSGTFTEFSNPTPLMNNDFTGTDEIQKINPLIAYPNPGNSVILLNKRIDYQLFDLKGELLQSGNNADRLDITGLGNGIYVLISSGHETLKIVVAK